MTDIFCPICHHVVSRSAWDASPPYRIGENGTHEPLVRDPGESDASWRDRLITAYRLCPAPPGKGRHLLPYDYANYTPVTIGLIGHAKAGKTHLLAAMIARLCSNDPVLDRLDLKVGALDLNVHRKYVQECVTPLIAKRQELPQTPARGPVEFCDALRITNGANRSFAVTFFDLAGERLAQTDSDEVRFYASADALLFVVDPESLPRRGVPAALPGDATFDVALRRLDARPRPKTSRAFHPVAAAVVVAKADLIQFDDRLVSDWLAVGSAEEEIELGTVERESEDVYAYLSQRRAGQWLRPAQYCYRSTLHFASATNSSAVGGRFPAANFRQRRVLKPLLAVFAMIGILSEDLLRPARPAAEPACEEAG